MDIVPNIKTLTASEARDQLYTLIKDASTGLKAFEIILRGRDPVVMMNKAELEAWQETLDILSNKREIESIRRAKKQKKNISHQKMLKEIGVQNAS